MAPNSILSFMLTTLLLLLLSRSKLGLQNCLNKLSSYCISWMLKINPKKTKIMVFQKGTKKMWLCFSHRQWNDRHCTRLYLLRDSHLVSRKFYTLTWTSSTKALHALFSLRRHTGFSKLKPSLANKIFDTMISPILTYNSEVWGAFVKSDFKSWDNSGIEKNSFTLL